VQVRRQAQVPPEQRQQACDRKRGPGREPRPGDRARDRPDAVADRQPYEGEGAEEANGDQGADKQTLQHAAGGRRQSLLVRAQVEGEEGRQQREPARVDNREAAGDERDRDRNGADPRSS